MVGELGDQRTVVSGRTGSASAGRTVPGKQLRRLGSDGRSLLASQFHDPDGLWQEVEQRAEGGRLADTLVFGATDDRTRASMSSQSCARQLESSVPDPITHVERGCGGIGRMPSGRARARCQPWAFSNPVRSAATSHSRRATSGSRVDFGGSIAFA